MQLQLFDLVTVQKVYYSPNKNINKCPGTDVNTNNHSTRNFISKSQAVASFFMEPEPVLVNNKNNFKSDKRPY